MIGDGTPASCTGQAVIAAVASGGQWAFNCGPGPYTIAVGPLVVGAGQKIMLDGGDLITLSGSDTLRPFMVEKGD